MNTAVQAAQDRLIAGRSWQDFGEKFGWLLISWEGTTSAKFCRPNTPSKLHHQMCYSFIVTRWLCDSIQEVLNCN